MEEGQHTTEEGQHMTEEGQHTTVEGQHTTEEGQHTTEEFSKLVISNLKKQTKFIIVQGCEKLLI